jgi:hypothetical protein
MHVAIPSLPQYVFMAWCLVKHRDNFTFTFIVVDKLGQNISGGSSVTEEPLSFSYLTYKVFNTICILIFTDMSKYNSFVSH